MPLVHALASHFLAAVAGAVLCTLWINRRAAPPWLRGPFLPTRLSELPSCPFELLAKWVGEAEAVLGFLEAHAMVVSTTSADGGATARTVVLQECSPQGLVFGSNRHSLKSRQAQQDSRAEAVLRFGQRQVRVRGELRLDDSRSSDSFGRVMSTARQGLHLLQQGVKIDEDAWQQLRSRLPRSTSGDAPMPPSSYAAFVLEPHSVEFYSGGSPFYFNDRFLYVRRGSAEAGFAPPERLQP